MSLMTLLLIMLIVFAVVIPSLQDRTITLKRLLLTPAIFMFMLYINVNKNFVLTPANKEIIVAGALVGIIVGMLMRLTAEVKADKQSYMIWIKGNLTNAAIFFSLFIIHFTMKYLRFNHPGYFITDGYYAPAILFGLAAVTCLTIGSNLCILIKFFCQDSTRL
jgi:hypothetical protein